MTTNWRPYAACSDSDPVMFDLDDNSHVARSLCADCPVRTDCLEEALRLRDVHGFRGGMTGQERADTLKRTRQPRAYNPPIPTPSVLALHAAGWDAKAIATRLGVSADSVRRVLRKVTKGQDAAA